VTPWEYVEIKVEVEADERVFKKVGDLLWIILMPECQGRKQPRYSWF
jgi:hypothetical protein